MSEMDWKRIYQEIQSRGCHEDFPQDLIDALRELVRQLDERYVKREEQHYHIEIDDPHGFRNDEPEPPLIFEEPEPQTGISDTADHCHSSTGTCKCPICYTWVYPKLVSRWSCNPDEDPHSPVQPKCEHFCHTKEYVFWEGKMWRFCPMCGLPLAEKEEK